MSNKQQVITIKGKTNKVLDKLKKMWYRYIERVKKQQISCCGK